MPSLGKNRGRDAGRSRNTTPMSTASTEHGSAMRLATPVATSWNDLLDIPKHGVTPHSSTLKGMLESVKNFSAVAADRVEMHDKGMRECAKLKKEEQERQHEFLVNAAEEEEKRLAALARKELEDRPPQLAVGTHSVAPQDGTSTKGTCLLFFFISSTIPSLHVALRFCLDSREVPSSKHGATRRPVRAGKTAKGTVQSRHISVYAIASSQTQV